MKKKIVSFVSAMMVMLSALPFTASADDNPDVSSYVQYYFIEKNKDIKSPCAYTFEDYIKYDLLLKYDDLSDSEIEKYRSMYDTTVSRYDVNFNYTRSEISGTNVPRFTLDDIDDIGRVVYEGDGYYGDTFLAYNNGDPAPEPDITCSSKTGDSGRSREYWLDDTGSKRLITNPYSDFAEYLEIFDERPDAENVLVSDDGKTFYIYEQIFMDKAVSQKRETYTSGIWKYRIANDDTAYIISADLPSEPISEPTVIPSELDGHTVTGVYFSFSGTGVTKLVYPESISSYIAYLIDCPYLEEVEINCPDLNKLIFDVILCPNLKKASLNTRSITSVYSETLEYLNIECEKYLGPVQCEKLTELQLNEGLYAIAASAFSDTTLLKSITIPKSVEVLGAQNIRYNNFKGDIGVNVIKGYYGTEAHRYAMADKYVCFIPLDDILYGDTNNDGTIGVADAVTLNRYLLGTGTVGYEGDLNKDGMVDAFDMPDMRKAIIQN